MRCAYIYIYLYAHGPVHSSVVSSAKKRFFSYIAPREADGRFAFRGAPGGVVVVVLLEMVASRGGVLGILAFRGAPGGVVVVLLEMVVSRGGVLGIFAFIGAPGGVLWMMVVTLVTGMICPRGVQGEVELERERYTEGEGEGEGFGELDSASVNRESRLQRTCGGATGNWTVSTVPSDPSRRSCCFICCIAFLCILIEGAPDETGE